MKVFVLRINIVISSYSFSVFILYIFVKLIGINFLFFFLKFFNLVSILRWPASNEA